LRERGLQVSGTKAQLIERLQQQREAVELENNPNKKRDSNPEEQQQVETKKIKLDDETTSSKDMYLDTINRSCLDFDFERLCSVTMSHNHVYCCLVCGKFFQGRGLKTPAYAHSIGGEDPHHVFMNLDDEKVYILPDGYQVEDPSLKDIQSLLHPRFTKERLDEIDRESLLTGPNQDLNSKKFYPGFIGLNNLKQNSYINSILVSLAHVKPLRNYFILDLEEEKTSSESESESQSSELVKRFSNFLKKFWNSKLFKAQVSPHELLQQIDLDSKGRFKLDDKSSKSDTTTGGGDPGDFLSWFLNTLHRDLGGNKKPNSSIIYSLFQGELRIDDQSVLKTGEYGHKPKFDLDREIKISRNKFLFLSLDLPPPPLFQSHLQNDIIPQVSLNSLLSKYNGKTTSEFLLPSSKEGGASSSTNELTLRRYQLEKLPEFIVLWVKRFNKNRFGEEEKNPTIVNFPLRSLDFKEYISETTGEEEEGLNLYYDLVSNVTHTSLAGTARLETQWKTFVHLTPLRDENGKLLPIEIETTAGAQGGGKKKKEIREEDEKWFEMQDLNVQEIEKGLVGLGESYIQVSSSSFSPRGRAN
jgi:U4/U6.U5 tri-snRNP-associated protein 2